MIILKEGQFSIIYNFLDTVNRKQANTLSNHSIKENVIKIVGKYSAASNC